MGIIYMSSNGLFLVDFAQRELLSWPFAMYLYQLYQSSAHLYDKFMIHTTFYHNGLSQQCSLIVKLEHQQEP